MIGLDGDAMVLDKGAMATNEGIVKNGSQYLARLGNHHGCSDSSGNEEVTAGELAAEELVLDRDATALD